MLLDIDTFVLLGRSAIQPVALILEMKGWDVTRDKPGSVESLVVHKGRYELHPSDQVRGYVEYCRNFHSAVLANGAQVAGCAFFTKLHDAGVYRQPTTTTW